MSASDQVRKSSSLILDIQGLGSSTMAAFSDGVFCLMLGRSRVKGEGGQLGISKIATIFQSNESSH